MEHVILVDEHDREVGTMEKMEAHEKAILHRAFSIFIFNTSGKMLVQQRALQKYHSAGLWTNACCSHPRPGETTIAAALRRLNEELGFDCDIEEVFNFTYKAPFDNGLTEYEYDHVFVGSYNGPIDPNPAEVKDYRFLSMEQLEASLLHSADQYTAWFKLAFPKIKSWQNGQLKHTPLVA